ncbi:carbohydrate-binding protein [Streptomyces sp. NPDC020917]|uniref:carbohydrate-binding protein n=1 Tax=Streptomyces sp. NPDC020917 TaxID=3365102 RepID=UPI0037A9D4E1
MRTALARRGATGLVGLSVLVGLVMYPSVVHAAAPTTYWVASPNDPRTPGNDANAGDSRHPFATIDHARQVVNHTLASGAQTGDIVVNIEPGTYYTPKPVTFNQSDSGTGGHQVIYQNAPGSPVGSARFVGGNRVTSAWNLVTSSTGSDTDLPAGADGHVYKTHVGTGTDFNTLYVDDTRATMARTPNLAVDPRFPSVPGPYSKATGGGMTGMTYSDADLPASSAAVKGLVDAQENNQLDAQLYVWDFGKDWMTDTIPIGSVDTSTDTITFKSVPGHPELNRPKYPVYSGSRYFLQGNLGFLDAPGEYYYNKTTGDLYYYPVNGANPNNESIVVPTTENIVNVAGASRTSPASNITFSGLEFEDTDFPDYYSYGWNWGDGGGGMGTYPPQAAGATLPSYSETSERVEFQTGTIRMTNASHVTVTDAHIKNAGMFGIELYLGVDHVTISHSLIEDTGHGGVNIEGGYPGTGGDASGNSYTNNNVVTDCLIHDIGQLVGQTSGVTINNATANTVSHSEIYNSPRRALFVMGGWPRNTGSATPNDNGYHRMTDLYAHDNVFSHDYLHGLQQDGGDDGAFFGAELYRGTDGPNANRPNYVDQMLIDKVGANPGMTDYAPNGMNLDMGDSGFQVSNLKAVNPQNFNAELNTILEYKDTISLTNTNIDYGTLVNQLATFDDSRMDYANIGLTAAFPDRYRPRTTKPASPKNVSFQDAFETGLDLTKWSYRGVAPQTSPEFMSEGVLGGKGALEIDSDDAPAGSKPVLVRDFGKPLHQLVSVQFYDRQNANLAAYDSGVSRPTTVKSLARADDGQHAVGLGIDTTLSSTDYVLQNGSTETATTVPRSYGWHQATWDYTSGKGVTVSIDGTVVATLSGITGVSHLELGSDDGKGVSYYDQVSVHGGKGGGKAPALPTPVPLGGGLTATDFYRSSGVHVSTAQAPESAEFAGPLHAGDYLDYRLIVPRTGAYSLGYRVAVGSGSTGEANLLIDGTSARKTALPSTGGLQNWTTVNDTVSLTSGIHTICLQATAGGWNLESAKLAYVAQSVPGTISAVSYDAESGAIQTVSGSEGSAVGYLAPNDSMDYKVDVASSGVYTVGYRVAVNAGHTGAVQLLVDGVAQKTTSLPSSGGWDSWETVKDTVSLTSGLHTLTILVVQNNWNFASFQLSNP